MDSATSCPSSANATSSIASAATRERSLCDCNNQNCHSRSREFAVKWFCRKAGSWTSAMPGSCVANISRATASLSMNTVEASPPGRGCVTS
jgi:hypothetical protein